MNITPKFVYDAANDFRTGSEMLYKNFGSTVFPLRSTIVLSALSAEIYLKCLLYDSSNDNNILKSHSLKLLFNKLEKDKQQKIEKQFKIIVNNKSKISDALNTYDNTFETLRYFYEVQNSDISLPLEQLFSLVQALHKTIKEINPQWE